MNHNSIRFARENIKHCEIYENDTKIFFEKGAVTKLENPTGTQYFEGEKGSERKVRITLPDGQTNYYEGEKDSEKLVRTTLPGGRTQH